MLPLVLGGIALAAVGYGVKEYCESEGCPWYDEEEIRSHTPTNIFESLHKQKLALYENKLLKLRVLLLKLEGVDEKLQFKDTVNIYEETLSSYNTEEDVKLYADRYRRVLDTSVMLVEINTNALEMLLDEKTHYKHLSKLEKKFVKEVYKVVNNVQKLLGLKILDQKVLNVEMICTLKKLETKLSVLINNNHIQNIGE